MKKVMAIALASAMALTFVGCGSSSNGSASTTAATTEAAATEEETEAAETETEATAEAAGDVMTYADYCAADVDTEVTVDTYVQAKQGWWENEGVGNATFYTQNEDGGYFLYNMPCTQEEYDQLVPGTEIKVTGYKSEWSGEVEITDATFEILDGTYIADPVDVTDKFGTDDINNYMNQLVTVKGAVVEASTDADGNEAAYLYNWDGSGSEGDDLYFTVLVNGEPYSFTVESYLCDKDSDVYKAVEALNVGDTIDLEGFLYWYEGPQPHVTSVTAAQ